MNKIKYLSEIVGATPLVKSKKNENLFLKLEFFNPTFSIKDRAVSYIIKGFEYDGLIKKGSTIVEATSGNTGIALASIASIKGYRAKIFMPENMSKERINAFKSFGVDLILTPKEEGMNGALIRAKKDVLENGSILLDQFNNPNNTKAHYLGTGLEIVDDLPKIDAFIAGVGTGGTVSGVGKRLKEYNKKIKIIAIEPKESNVLSGGLKSIHKIQGIGAGFVPNIYDNSLVDEIITVSSDEALSYQNKIIREEGIYCGISSGANYFGALKVLEKYKFKNLVTIVCDVGDRYSVN